MYQHIKEFIKPLIPLYIRKKIRFSIESVLFTFKRYQIEPETIKELAQNSNLSSKGDIVNFSLINWKFRFQRPQHLATNLSLLGYRVFFVEPEFNPCGLRKEPPITIKKIQNNLYSVRLAAPRNVFIHHDKLSPRYQKVIANSFKKFIKTAKVTNPISKLDHPFWANFIDDFSLPVIYDCMDNHQHFLDHLTNINQLEKKMFKTAQSTIVSSQYLLKLAKKQQAKNITVITNAGDYSHFHQSSTQVPTDIQKISHPIAGYFGAIAEWFDDWVLEDILNKNPTVSFVLIGQVVNPKITNLSKKFSNLFLLGEKPYHLLPRYLQQFDSCLIPFKLTPLIRATHPVKIYEYFSAGKPVVSSKIPEIEKFKPLIYFATKNNFSTQLAKSLAETNPTFKRKRQLIAKSNSWEKQTDLLDQTIIKNFFPKISIIILSYNHPDLLKLTLDSVINQSNYPNLEILVVDNASNYKTINLLKKYKNIKLILNKENYGFAKGNNIGLAQATGDYLVLLNNDVIVTPGWIHRLLFHCQKPNVGLVGPVTNSIGNEAKIDATLDNYFSYVTSHWGQTLEVKNIAAFCWIMSRQTYRKVGNLDERFGRGMFEDDDYCRRVVSHGQKILIADDVFVHHFGGASFKELADSTYQQIFNQNKQLFETKWGTRWIPHHYRK